MSQSHLRLIRAEVQPLESLLPNLFIPHPRPAAQVLLAELTPDSSLSLSPRATLGQTQGCQLSLLCQTLFLHLLGPTTHVSASRQAASENSQVLSRPTPQSIPSAAGGSLPS